MMLRKPGRNDVESEARTVLVVDDSASMRVLISRLLETLGFFTVVASSGHRALKAIVDYRPDAVFTDLEMPDGNGRELVAAIRFNADRTVRDLPIIVCSSRGDAETVASLTRLGASAFLTKPISYAALADATRQFFGKRLFKPHR
jgi:chemosensory pili system protein ChpA (sensor histidine kinase/response regulator)